AVNADVNWLGVLGHEWLMENVVPYLPLVTDDTGYQSLDLHHPHVKSKRQIRWDLLQFFKEVGETESIELWGWVCDYDHVLLNQFLHGPMVQKPLWMPYYTRDLFQVTEEWGITREDVEMGEIRLGVKN